MKPKNRYWDYRTWRWIEKIKQTKPRQEEKIDWKELSNSVRFNLGNNIMKKSNNSWMIYIFASLIFLGLLFSLIIKSCKK